MNPNSNQFKNVKSPVIKNIEEAHRADQSLSKALWAGKLAEGEYTHKTRENAREIDTARLVHYGTPVSTLEETVKTLQKDSPETDWGYEISGDALARAQKGQTPKLHR